MSADFDAIVIGGGFAGLSAAVELARRGVRLLLLEARPNLGGRATAFTDPQTGERIDNGQHVVLGCYHHTFDFLRTIGADSFVRLQPTLDVLFIDRTGKRSRLRCPPLKPPWHLLGGLIEWDALDHRDRLAALSLAAPLRIARRRLAGDLRLGAASPGETVNGWLKRNGQTPRLREMLWEPLALAALNQSPAEAAALPFVRVLAEMFGGEPSDAAIGIPTKPLDQMYAIPARAFIEARGGVVRTGSSARVVSDGNRIDRILVENERLATRLAIVAVPWWALPEVFVSPPPSLASTISAAMMTAASPIVTVNLWLDGPLVGDSFFGLPGRTMQWVFDKRSAWGDRTSHVSVVSSGAADIFQRNNEALIALALEEIMEAVPEGRAAQLRRASVIRERRATFSLAPGQPSRPSHQTDVKGLFLAGDWIDTGLPATIEGAVLSGRRAAEAAFELASH